MSSLAQSSLTFLREQLRMCDDRISLLKEKRVELLQEIHTAESAIRVADANLDKRSLANPNNWR